MNKAETTIEIGVVAGARTASPRLATLERIFSFPVVLGALLVGAVFYAGRNFVVDPDLWWHLKTGQNILATHHWPTTDPYSFTVAGQPWLAYEWLGEVLLAAAEKAGGLRALDALLIALGSLVVLALYAYATLRTNNPRAAFVAQALLLPLTTVTFSLRPQMLGFLFLVLTLIALERYRQGEQRALWLLPPLMLIWVNTHGSWIIGMGVIAVHYLCGLTNLRLGGIEARAWSIPQRERLALVFLLCLLAIPLTPYGTRVAASPFEYAFDLPLNKANIQEWLPMNFSMAPGKIFLAFLVAFLVAQALRRLTWRLEDFVLFLGGLVMGCLHMRFVLLFVPFFVPLLASIGAHWLPPYEKKKEHHVLNAAVLFAILLAIMRLFPSEADLRSSVARKFPVGAVEYLSSHRIPGPTFNSYDFGGYLIWAAPDRKLFVDGRADVYERGGALADYLQVAYLKPAAFSVLRSYGIQSCLLDRKEPLVTVLAASPEWQQDYSDELSVLFVRRTPSERAQLKPLP